MTDYKEEQRNEIEALESIYPDELTIVSNDPELSFTMDIKTENVSDDPEENDTYGNVGKDLSKAKYNSGINSDANNYGRGLRKKIRKRLSSSEDEESNSYSRSKKVRNAARSSEDETIKLLSLPMPELPPLNNEVDNSRVLETPSSCSQTSSKEYSNAEFQSMVFKELKVIKSLLRQNQEMIDSIFTIMNKIDTGGNLVKKEQNIKLRTDLPLKTMEQMDSLEQELEQNPEAINQLTHQLKIIGGINFENMVRRILRALMEDCLAAQFSWLGSKGKRPFASLFAMKCVFGAVRSNLMFGQKQDSEIEIIIRNWLRHAPARCKH